MTSGTAMIMGYGDDGWAIFAPPPGVRDLGCPDLWARSLARSHARRRPRRGAMARDAKARVSGALVAVTLAAPAAPLAQAAPSGATATSPADLHRGSRGDGVAAAQRALGIAADGIFGPQTRRAVRAFQAARGLAVDGVIGPVTRAALFGGAPTGTAAAVRDPGLGPATTQALQRALGVAADGEWGPVTHGAVRAYQAAHGLAVDGVPGPATLGALGVSRAQPAAGGGGSGPLAAVAAARTKLGAPYAYGGNGPAWDCSGLTTWALAQAGITVPRTSFAQFGVGAPVSRGAIQAGDLVFFNTAGPGASDVGIATGPGSVISATTHGVMEHATFDAYWGAHYVGARRVG